jgi:hypothetical protein
MTSFFALIQFLIGIVLGVGVGAEVGPFAGIAITLIIWAL